MKNPEVIRIYSDEQGKQFVTLSYQDFESGHEINNFYTWCDVPVNLRPMQKSVRGNYLVDQSVKEEPVAATYPATPYDNRR